MRSVLHIITGLNDGGAEGVLYRICLNDTQNRHIVISMMDEGKYGPLLKEAGIDVHCLYAPRGRISYKTIRNLWKLVRSIRPNVVQTWMYHANLVGGLVAYFAGSRRIIWSLRHASLSFDDSKSTTRLIDRICAIVSHVVPQKIIAISNKVTEVHLSKGYASKFTVIYNGCDTGVYYPDRQKVEELTDEFGIKPGIPTIGCVARWTPEKDHATLLKAIALAARRVELQAILVGVGCDPANRDLSTAITDLGIEDKVFLVGPRRDIPHIMNLLDIHVLPSKNEAFGNVIIEAMSCGTPCISTDVGDARHIIGGTGWIVDRQNPSMMSNAIVDAISLMNNQERRNIRKSISRTRVKDEFSIQTMISAYRAVWTAC